MKTLAQVRAEYRKRNREFMKLTPAEQRVAIAQDVIKSIIPSKKIDITKGEDVNIDAYGTVDGQLHEQLMQNKISCHCCAKGALLLAATLNKDNLTVSEANQISMNPDFKIRKQLKGIFSKNQLDLIEAAFEGSNINNSSYVAKFDFYGYFLEYMYSSTERLKAIMQNIIDNKGTFKL